MKYAGMPMGMWALYRRSFRDQMVNVLGFRPQAAAAVMRRAKPRYREIIARLPEFEKADRFKMNEVNCALFSAVLLSMPEKPDIDKLADYYEAAMMTKPTQWFCRQGGRRKFTGRDVRAMEETARLKAADRNPYSWNMEFYPYADGSGYEARFTKCGICTLMRELGLYDAVPAMCRLDYAMSKAGGASTFVREFTLASGGPYCDCGYKKKTRKIGLEPCCRLGNAEKPSIKETPMKADYKNWVPKGMLTGFAAGAAGLAAGSAALGVLGKSRGTKALSAVAGLGAAGCGAWALWCAYARSKFSYDGKRKLSKQIVEGTAEFVTLPEGGVGLDVGCGSGALTIACAKRNPQGRMVGCDAWGPEYASFSQQVCEQNAWRMSASASATRKSCLSRMGLSMR